MSAHSRNSYNEFIFSLGSTEYGTRL